MSGIRIPIRNVYRPPIIGALAYLPSAQLGLPVPPNAAARQLQIVADESSAFFFLSSHSTSKPLMFCTEGLLAKLTAPVGFFFFFFPLSSEIPRGQTLFDFLRGSHGRVGPPNKAMLPDSVAMFSRSQSNRIRNQGGKRGIKPFSPSIFNLF